MLPPAKYLTRLTAVRSNVIFPTWDSFLQELVRRCEMDAAEGSRGVPFHGYCNNAAAAVKAPRQAYENTCTRCLGDAVKAMLSSSEGNTNKPIVVIVRQIHDWSKRYKMSKIKTWRIFASLLCGRLLILVYTTLSNRATLIRNGFGRAEFLRVESLIYSRPTPNWVAPLLLFLAIQICFWTLLLIQRKQRNYWPREAQRC